MSVPKLSESKFIHLSVMIIFIPEKPLAMTAFNYGTNKYNKSFLIFRKAATITESPHKLLTVSGDRFFSYIISNPLSIFFIVFW